MVKERNKVLIVPGWTYSEDKNLPLLQAFKELGYQAELLQVPGLTGKKLETAWNLSDYQNWLHEKLLAETKVTLIGHSNGGRIILKLLSIKIEQNKVDKLILIDSAGLIDNRFHKVVIRKVSKFIAKMSKKITHNENLKKFFYKIIRERDYYQASPIMRQTMANLIEEDLRQSIGEIENKTLIIWGEKDKMTPMNLAKEMNKKMPRARLEIVAGAKHVPQSTHLERTMSIITKFLEEDDKI